MVSSTLGSPTKTCWKRRSRAGSFSIRSRYSSKVVAPIIRSSPRASIGFSMLPASIEESPVAPAPTTVCSSSMKVITWPSASRISVSTALSRSSNSPRYFAPATMLGRSRLTSRRPLSESGTSPATSRWARPSTTAVLPTPGSPISTGLFLVRRASTWTTRRISVSRPITGSSLPSWAWAVRSTPYWSRAEVVPSASGLVTRLLPRSSLNLRISASWVTLRSSRILRASDCTAASAISRCSVATYASPICSARFSASASTRANEPDSCGWLTEDPLAAGSLAIAPWAAASTTVGSAPTACSSGATVLPGTISKACSRCEGSALGLPAVRALRRAAETASRLLVVSLLVSIWVLRWLRTTLSLFHSTLRCGLSIPS